MGRPVHRGVGAEQHPLRADLVDQPPDLLGPAPGGLQVQVGQLLGVPRGPPPTLREAEEGVVQHERHLREPLREAADQVGIRRSRGGVHRDRHPGLGRHLEERVQPRACRPGTRRRTGAASARRRRRPAAAGRRPAPGPPGPPTPAGSATGPRRHPVDEAVVLPRHQRVGHAAGRQRRPQALEAHRVEAGRAGVDVRVDRVDAEPQPVVRARCCCPSRRPRRRRSRGGGGRRCRGPRRSSCRRRPAPGRRRRTAAPRRRSPGAGAARGRPRRGARGSAPPPASAPPREYPLQREARSAVPSQRQGPPAAAVVVPDLGVVLGVAGRPRGPGGSTYRSSKPRGPQTSPRKTCGSGWARTNSWIGAGSAGAPAPESSKESPSMAAAV